MALVQREAGVKLPFEELLERAGMTKAELGRELGLSLGTVSRWGDRCPRYAEAYLHLVVAYNRVRP